MVSFRQQRYFLAKIGPEKKQLPVVLEAKQAGTVGQWGTIFEPVHGGSGEATDRAAHGSVCTQSDGDVLWPLCDLQPSRGY